MDQNTALTEAIRIAGGLDSFTAAVKAPSTHAVKAWKTTRVPEIYCPRIERVTGIACELLRPDVEWCVLRAAKPHTTA
jgi:DNA-binding transcriptional regulator YdaS (Cro superfamily)